MAAPVEEIVVSIVDANDNSIAPKPVAFQPSQETTCHDITSELEAAGYGQGLLLDKAGKTVMRRQPVPAGNYKYRVTAAAPALTAAVAPTAAPVAPTAGGVAGPNTSFVPPLAEQGGGLAEVVIAAVTTMTTAMTTMTASFDILSKDVKQAIGGSVAASEMEQLVEFRSKLNITVLPFCPEGEELFSLEQVARLPPERDGFKWDPHLTEPAQAYKYRPHLQERVEAAIREDLAVTRMAKRRKLDWRSATGTTVTCRVEESPFYLKAKNDEVLAVKAMSIELGAVVGVEMKPCVYKEMLLQMEAEFYSWDMFSMFPFCQIGMDGVRGGAALWYEGYRGRHIIRYQVFNSSAAVYRFIAKLVTALPPIADDFKWALENCTEQQVIPETFPSPARRKLFGSGGAYHTAMQPGSSNATGEDPGAGAAPGQGSQPAGGQSAAQQGKMGRGGGGTGMTSQGGSGGSGTRQQSSSQVPKDVCNTDQLRRLVLRPADPLTRKAVGLLCRLQADRNEMEEVEDPGPYIAAAEPVEAAAVPGAVYF